MSCSGCERGMAVRPNAICPNVVHWRAWSERLEAVIEEANNVLFDSSAGDVEHYIECHADTLPVVFRSVAAGHAAALGILQVVIHERIEDMVVADPSPPLRPKP